MPDNGGVLGNMKAHHMQYGKKFCLQEESQFTLIEFMLLGNGVQYYMLSILLDFYIPIQTSIFSVKTLIYDVVQPQRT